MVLFFCSAKSFAGVQFTGPNPSDQLKNLDAIVEDAIRQGQVPGAVLLVWHNGEVVYQKAFGYRSLEPARLPMSVDTIFDIASLTKVVATTTAIMRLVEEGKVRLNDPVVRYLPEFGQNGKQDVTVRQLLTHFSGLPKDLPLNYEWQGRETGYRLAFFSELEFPPGSHFQYSDINFIVLGAIVERVSSMTLDAYCQKNIFTPLGMTHTRFLPPASWLPSIAPTQYDEHNHMLHGVVHDPTARRMGGVAGHAGVFSTAEDLSKFAQSLLSGNSVLQPLSIEKMTTPEQPPTAPILHGFGWDIDSPYSSNRGDLFPVGSFGHTGFTGTSIWIDPTTQTYIILLTNSVHPNGKGSAIALRAKVANAVASQIPLTQNEQVQLRLQSITGYNEAETASHRLTFRNGNVLTGIDVLEKQDFAALRGNATTPKKIGILTNQTGLDAQGQRTIDVLAHAPGISVQAIFSPEHGVTGTLDTTDISNTKDVATGLPVYSVYGASDKDRHPSLDVLKTLDAVVIDLQNVGARFYTYETTLGYFLEAAAETGTEIVVLDRPNPVTGSIVQGPVSDADKQAFVNYFPLPVRHGMTMGELAKMFNSERQIHARLTVIPMQGWLRGDWFDSTGAAWVNPSPNLRNLTQTTLYPGVAIVEGTNLSVGRGTDTPFEVVGAPWIKGREFTQYLNARNISGVRFVPITFTPNDSNFTGERCEGVNLVLLDRNAFDAPQLGVELASALHELYPDEFHIEKMQTILANQAVYDAILQGEDPRRIADDWQDSLDKFQQLRKKYLLY
ncbi:MAG TPA: serine hydrolase [Terriglobales bacterium]